MLDLGAKAIWISPVLKNPRPDWEHNYHGYGIQDFLSIDERFAFDGTQATAERELTELIEQAHARGLYIILDIVIKHAARIEPYVKCLLIAEEIGDVCRRPRNNHRPDCAESSFRLCL